MNAILVKRLPHADGLPLPCRMSDGASGCDVVAAIEDDRAILPGERLLVPTGLVLQIPRGYEVQVRPRSGLAINHGITVLNSPGTIDADYRGEVQIILINLGSQPYTIQRGDRIAQLVPAKIADTLTFIESSDVDTTQRGSGGFGSSGI